MTAPAGSRGAGAANAPLANFVMIAVRSIAGGGAMSGKLVRPVRCGNPSRRGDVAPQHALGRRDGELRLAQELVRGEHVLQLLPDGRHQVLLTLLHHLGAEPGRDPIAHVEVELREPARVGPMDRRLRRVPAAIDRRRDLLDLVDERLHERGQARVDGRSRGFVDGQHSAERSVGRAGTWGQPESGPGDVQRPRADSLEVRGLLQHQHERAEVALAGGRELPVVVDGQHHARVGGRPGIEAERVRHIGPEPAECADRERRHHTGEVGAVGIEHARTDQPGQDSVRLLLRDLLGPRARVARYLRVCPGVRLIERRKLRHLRSGHGELGERHARLELDAPALLEHHQRDPRPKRVHGGRAERREQPWQVVPVELHMGVVGRLEVERARHRERTDHLALVDACDVARPEHVQVHGCELVRDGVARHLHAHRQLGAAGRPRRLRLIRQGGGQTGAHPARERVAHQAASRSGTACSASPPTARPSILSWACAALSGTAPVTGPSESASATT